MEKYHRVDRTQKEEHVQAAANEIRLTQNGKIRNYINYATNLLKESNEECIYLKAMGNVISKAVTISEVLKHRVPDLHQITEIGLHETTDVYEPLEEGLDRIEIQRQIPFISIQLSLVPLDTTNPGYQSPLPAELVSKDRRNSRSRSSRNAKKEDEDSEGEEGMETSKRGGQQSKKRSPRNNSRRTEEKENASPLSENEESDANLSDKKPKQNRRKGQGRGRGRGYRGRNSNRMRGRGGKDRETAEDAQEQNADE